MKTLKLDPRVKTFIFIVACLISANVNDMIFQLYFVLFLLSLFLFVGEFKSSLKLFFIFLGAVFLGYVTLLYEDNSIMLGVSFVAVIVRKYVPVILAFSLMFQTTKISEFMAAFEKIHLPSAFVIPFAVFFRFLPTVKQELDGIRQAMSFRGIGLNAGNFILHPILMTEYILVPLLSSCVLIMDELVAASLVRGLDSERSRTCYLKISMKSYDYLILFVTLGFSSFIYL